MGLSGFDSSKKASTQPVSSARLIKTIAIIITAFSFGTSMVLKLALGVDHNEGYIYNMNENIFSTLERGGFNLYSLAAVGMYWHRSLQVWPLKKVTSH